MGNSISIHIGINRIDLSKYIQDEYVQLTSTINDSKFYKGIAASYGYNQSYNFYNDDANAQDILDAINTAGSQLNDENDILFITYSGHGTQVDNNQSPTGKDQAFVCYDRLLFDYELQFAWTKFKPNVRIVFVADCCHSGSIIMAGLVRKTRKKRLKKKIYIRGLSTIFGNQQYQNNKIFYDGIAAAIPAVSPAINCEIILIAACKDDELATDDGNYGSLTQTIRDLFSASPYTKGYIDFLTDIIAQIQNYSTQTPMLTKVGIVSTTFLNESPFSV